MVSRGENSIICCISVAIFFVFANLWDKFLAKVHFIFLLPNFKLKFLRGLASEFAFLWIYMINFM